MASEKRFEKNEKYHLNNDEKKYVSKTNEKSTRINNNNLYSAKNTNDTVNTNEVKKNGYKTKQPNSPTSVSRNNNVSQSPQSSSDSNGNRFAGEGNNNIVYSKYGKKQAKKGSTYSGKVEKNAQQLEKHLEKGSRNKKLAKDLYQIRKNDIATNYAEKRLSNAEHSEYSKYHLDDGTGVNFSKKIKTDISNDIKTQIKPKNVAKRTAYNKYTNVKNTNKEQFKNSVNSQFEYVQEKPDQSSVTKTAVNEGKYRAKGYVKNKGKEILHDKKEIHKLKKQIKHGEISKDELHKQAKLSQKSGRKKKLILNEKKKKHNFINITKSRAKHYIANAKKQLATLKATGKLLLTILTHAFPVIAIVCLLLLVIGGGVSCVGCVPTIVGGAFNTIGTATATTYGSDTQDLLDVVDAYSTDVTNEINKQIDAIKNNYTYVELPDIRTNSRYRDTQTLIYSDWNYRENSPTYYNNIDNPINENYSFDPYTLCSYFSAKYGKFALDGDIFGGIFGEGTTGIRGELEELAKEQIQVTATWELQTYAGKVYQYVQQEQPNPYGEGEPIIVNVPTYNDSMGLTEGCTDQHLVFTVSSRSFEDIVRSKLSSDDEKTLFEGYLATKGNRPTLFASANGSTDYIDNGDGTYTLADGSIVRNPIGNIGNYGYDGPAGVYPGTSWTDIANYASGRGAVYLYQCTTFTAYRMKQMTGLDIPIADGAFMAQALVQAFPDKYRLSSEPAPGSVFSCGTSSEHPYGHVGIIEGVQGDTLILSDGNTTCTLLGEITNIGPTGSGQHNQVPVSKALFEGFYISNFGSIVYAVPIQ